MTLYHSKLVLSLSITLFFNFSAHAVRAPTTQTEPINYQEIGNSLLSAMGFIEQIKELTKEDLEKMLRETPQLSAGEKLKLTCEIFNTQPSINTQILPTASYQAMRSTIKELELFCCQGAVPQNHLFSKLDHTQTTFGQAILAKMLTEPSKNIDTIGNLQSFVKELASNKKLMAKFDKLITLIAQRESDILSFWQKETDTNRVLKTSLYAPKWLNFMNSNSLTLSLWRTIQHPVMQPFEYTGILLSAIGCSIYLQLPSTNRNLLFKKTIAPITLQTCAYTAGTMAITSTVINLKKIKHDEAMLRYMQTRLSGIATLLKTAHEFNTIVTENNIAIHGLFMQHMGIEHLEQQKQKLAQLKTLVGYLETATFAGDYSFFSNSGRILAAFSLIQTLKNEFVGLMQAVGEVDACLSIAKLYMSLQENSNATYCFVDYVEHDTPYLHLENFWNPIIDPSVVVTNSIELGGANSPRNIVVTGSNTGGKSTILKAVVANIMLSRLGIAPARKAVMTPFTYLATSMNIGDDTAGGVSLFKAEVLRAKSILNNVKSLQPNQFAFLAIDELFVGTASEKGEEAACKFAETLNALPNTMFTFATHFKKATTLEQRTNSTCKNYMVEAYKDDTGTIVRPFKLEAGISTSNIANDILQENISSIDFLESSVETLA